LGFGVGDLGIRVWVLKLGVWGCLEFGVGVWGCSGLSGPTFYHRWTGQETRTLKLHKQHPKPYSPHPKLYTPHLVTYTLLPIPFTLHPRSGAVRKRSGRGTLKPNLQTLNLKPQTLDQEVRFAIDGRGSARACGPTCEGIPEILKTNPVPSDDKRSLNFDPKP